MYEYGYMDEGLESTVPPETRRLITHPSTFGAIVGVTNGVIAAVRGKEMTVRGALATTAVLGLGEWLLSRDETTTQRQGRSPIQIGLLSALGVLGGLAYFTDWEKWAGGDRPVLIARGPSRGVDRPALVPEPPTAAV